MATSVNMNGKGTGRKGSTVYKIVHGVQVQQEYNPHVSNPNTTKQQNTRSRFKLMSQLAAAMAPYAVYKREGLTSPRNVFIRENFKHSVAEEGNSAAALMNFQLAKGVSEAPAMAGFGRQEQTVTIEAIKPEGVDALMAVIFVRNADGSLSPFNSGIMQPVEGSDVEKILVTEKTTNKEMFGFVYGMTFKDQTTKTNYEDYLVNGNIEVATLVKENVISTSNMTFTKTASAHVDSAEGITYNIQVYSQNPTAGTVAMTQNSQTGQVTLTATPKAGYIFLGWRKSGSQETFNEQNPYTFLPLRNETYWGIFLQASPEV